MRYEHLVEINDPHSPLIFRLTRHELWQGLVRRAYAPQEFIYGLDAVVVAEVASDDATKVLERTLDFGSFTVKDIVRLRENESTSTDVEAGADWPRSRLVISIEEPQPDCLFLRFVYEWDENLSDNELDRMTWSIRQQAYHASDIDTVVRLRELAQGAQA